jgi:hypothetical protein
MIKYQQGDVLIRRLKSPIEEKTNSYSGEGTVSLADKSDRWNQKNRTVIAEGEVTGHAHAFNNNNNPDVTITLFKAKKIWGTRLEGSDTPNYIRIEGGDAVLTHEEHNALSIPPGEYEISQVREFDYLRNETRRVVD